MKTKTIRRAVTNNRGQALIEFAVILPFLALFLFAIVDYGIALNRRIALEGAMREGARYGAVTTDETLIKERTAGQALAIIDPSDVAICYEDINGGGPGDVGDAIRVYLDPPFTWDLPFVSGVAEGFFGSDAGEIEMSASATARLETTVTGAIAC